MDGRISGGIGESDGCWHRLALQMWRSTHPARVRGGLKPTSTHDALGVDGAEAWKGVFLEQGTRGLRIRGEPEERELTLARAKIGELMMRLELAEDLIEKRGFTDEWKRRAR